MAETGDKSMAPEELGLGATGEFPKGKINEDDQGELRVALGINKEHKRIIVDFGKEVAWLGMGADEARALAAGLIDVANKLDAEDD